MVHPNSPIEQETTSYVAVFVRIFWMFIGPVALAGCLVSILQNRGSVVSWVDVVYGVTLPLLVAARYADVRFYKGATAYGEPATMKDWRRYTLTTCAGSLLAWGAAHGIAYFLMMK